MIGSDETGGQANQPPLPVPSPRWGLWARVKRNRRLAGTTRPVTRLRADHPQSAVGCGHNSMSTTDDAIILRLTDARPMRVRRSLWPIVAKASEDRDHNNQELNKRYYLRVRQHARLLTPGEADAMEWYGADREEAPSLAPHPDGRVVVVGWSESSWQGEHGASAGHVTTLDEAPAVIRRVGEAIGAPEYLIDECCNDLPPVDETAEG